MKDSTEYLIKVRTSDVLFSGTDDNVYINIIGELKSTQNQKLTQKWQNSFERGRTDEFKVFYENFKIKHAIYHYDLEKREDLSGCLSQETVHLF